MAKTNQLTFEVCLVESLKMINKKALRNGSLVLFYFYEEDFMNFKLLASTSLVSLFSVYGAASPSGGEKISKERFFELERSTAKNSEDIFRMNVGMQEFFRRIDDSLTQLSLRSFQMEGAVGSVEKDAASVSKQLDQLREDFRALSILRETLEATTMRVRSENSSRNEERFENLTRELGNLNARIACFNQQKKEEEAPSEEVLKLDTEEKDPLKNPISAVDLLAHLNSIAIGNDRAKKDLAVCFSQQLKRAKKIIEIRKAAKEKDPQKPIQEEPKDPAQRIFVIGESGSGKNYLIEEAARKTGLPFIHIDASVLTAAGYQGSKIDVELAGLEKEDLGEFGIVFLNEFDKLSSRASGPKEGVGGATAQNQLLTFLEGADSIKKLKTKNLLVIAAGAFSHINRNGRTELTKKELQEEGGVRAEVIGRFSLIQLDSPSKETFIRWLENPNQPFQRHIKDLKENYKIEIKFGQANLLDLLADRLSKSLSKTNFRHGKDIVDGAFARIARPKILEESMMEAFKDIPQLVQVQEREGRTIFTIKNIDFFVKEETQKTPEEKLKISMQTDEYRSKVDEYAQDHQSKKDADALASKAFREKDQQRRNEEKERDLRAQKEAERLVPWVPTASWSYQVVAQTSLSVVVGGIIALLIPALKQK
ncbi:MAG: AAA family ATPase [Bacteriovoracaceae bacterium]|nr:AAA family ATPase [Bacteriovoracaceae bacterium]